MTATQRHYRRLKALGICVHCYKVPAMASHVVCETCLEFVRLASARRYALGLDREKKRANRRKHYYVRKSRGVCSNCSRPESPQFVHCDDCRNATAKHGYDARAKAKAEVFAALGGKCARCGFDDTRALQIDHIIACGTKNRRRIRHDGLIRFLAREVLPAIVEGKRLFQLLCANCNWIKRYENNETQVSRFAGAKETG